MSLASSIGLKSLLAAQAGLESVGHNLANANTPGYSRQTLYNSTSAPIRMGGLLRGTGLQLGVVQRTVDTLLHARIARQVAAVGRSEAKVGALSEVEAMLGSGGGVPKLLQSFFSGISSLTSAPDDSVLRGGVVQGTDDLASGLREVVSRLDSLAQDTLGNMSSMVDQVNVLADEVGELNRRIRELEFSSGPANDLRDQRDQAVLELARLVDAQVIEQADGVRVLVGGHQLVGPNSVAELSVVSSAGQGTAQFFLGNTSSPVKIAGGALGGLNAVLSATMPDLQGKLDSFARALILEANRVHSSGVGSRGPFQQLVASNAVADSDGDGNLGEELLSKSGLPFDVVDGELYVTVTHAQSGQAQRSRIAIDAGSTTVDGFLQSLNELGPISAKLDSTGHVRIAASAGYGFDFGLGLDPNPDPAGSFGGGHASLASSANGPFGVSAGDSLQLSGPLGPFTVTFPAGSIAQNGQAQAQELAAVLNADAQFSANGLTALALGDRLVVQTVGTGASNAFTVVGGSALTGLGWTAGTAVAGSNTAVDVVMGGRYLGTANGKLVLEAASDGVVGSSPSLLVRVFDETGAQLSEFDLGANYVPGTAVEVAPGVWAKFGVGTLSATHGDFFSTDLVADSDTTDVLVALGLNGLFVGQDAASIAINKDIAATPDLLAAALSSGGGDAQNLLQLLALDSAGLEELGGATLGEGYADAVNGLGLELQGEGATWDAEQFVLDGLEARRDEVSGVNVDEELVRMIEHEQAFAAAAQFLRVVNDLSSELMNIL